jgi:hypothetical protein
MSLSDRQKAWLAAVSVVVFLVSVAAYSLVLAEKEKAGTERYGIWRTKRTEPLKGK